MFFPPIVSHQTEKGRYIPIHLSYWICSCLHMGQARISLSDGHLHGSGGVTYLTSWFWGDWQRQHKSGCSFIYFLGKMQAKCWANVNICMYVCTDSSHIRQARRPFVRWKSLLETEKIIMNFSEYSDFCLTCCIPGIKYYFYYYYFFLPRRKIIFFILEKITQKCVGKMRGIEEKFINCFSSYYIN